MNKSGMKVLLIAPPLGSLRYTTFEPVYKNEIGQRPPLGLLYIAAYLRKTSSHSVTILDCGIEQFSYGDLRKRIKEIKPDVVGIQTFTFTLIDALRTAAEVKGYCRDIPVVFGGPHVSIYPRACIMHPDIDYIVRGEAEISFKRLIDNIGDESVLSIIPGIGFKKGDDVIITEESPEIDNLDELPFPDRTMLPYRKYRSVFSGRAPSTIMMTSRGCPYNCIFCARMGKKFRTVSPIKVIEEIDHCLSLGIRDISFADDTFTIDKKRILELCRLIREKRFRFDWDIKTRVDAVDYELLSAMKEAGCNRINFGVESASSKVLKELNKDITIDQIETAFGHARKLGIKALAFLMIGSPSETREDMEETFRFVKRLRADYIQYSITVPSPGTELYKDLLKAGFFKADVWREFAFSPESNFELPPLATKSFSIKQLRVIIVGFYRRFYFAPRSIAKTLLGLRSMKQLILKLKIGIKILLRNY